MYACYSIHSNCGSLCGTFDCDLYTPISDSIWAIGEIYYGVFYINYGADARSPHHGGGLSCYAAAIVKAATWNTGYTLVE